MNLSTSSAFVNIKPSWESAAIFARAGCACRRAATTTLGTCRFRAVSRVFHACYAWLVASSPMVAEPVAGPGLPRGTVDGVSASSARGAQAPESRSAYPGERFGLPQNGPRSVAGMGRHVGALLIDWFACMLIAFAALHPRALDTATFSHLQSWTLAVFAIETYVLTALTGLTLGKRLVRIRVARLDGKPVGFVWSLVRTLLLLAVIPPLVTDRDLRGLHDRAANTIVIRF